MSIITPEMIEAGARAASDEFCRQWKIPPVVWGEVWDRDREARITQSRACLESALPLILERAAKEAEGPLLPGEKYRGNEEWDWPADGLTSYGRARDDAATAIRSLQTKDNGFLATLTPEQREKALSYRGPDGPIGQTKDNA